MPTITAVPKESINAFIGLTDFLYQRDRETIAFSRSDLAVSGTGSSSVVQVVGIRAKSVALSCCIAFAIAR